MLIYLVKYVANSIDDPKRPNRRNKPHQFYQSIQQTFTKQNPTQYVVRFIGSVTYTYNYLGKVAISIKIGKDLLPPLLDFRRADDATRELLEAAGRRPALRPARPGNRPRCRWSTAGTISRPCVRPRSDDLALFSSSWTAKILDV